MKTEYVNNFPVVSLYFTLEKINRTRVRDMFLLKLAEEYGENWFLKREIANIAIEFLLIADEFRSMSQAAQQLLFLIAAERKNPVNAIWPVTVPFNRKFSTVNSPSQISGQSLEEAWGVIHSISKQSYAWQGFVDQLALEKAMANRRSKVFDEAGTEIILEKMPSTDRKTFLELLVPTNIRWKN